MVWRMQHVAASHSRRLLAFVMAMAASAAVTSGCCAEVGEVVPGIAVPEGFAIRVFAADVSGARSLALGRRGTVFVGTRRSGKVYAVEDKDGDFRADRVVVLAQGLNSPNGVAFRDGSL